jgi:hypothetical protein
MPHGTQTRADRSRSEPGGELESKGTFAAARARATRQLPTVQPCAVVFFEVDGEPPAAARSRVAEAVADAGGELVQVMHRLVLAAFSSASSFARLCRGLGPDVRAGASCGDVLFEGGLLHGLPVVEASRLKDAASPGQLLCARRLVRLAALPPEAFRPLDDRMLEGLASPLAVCELLRA